MAEKCKFPNCKRLAEKNGYCIGHKSYASFTAATAPKRVAKESEKRKPLNREYKKIVAQKMVEGKQCEIKSPVCIGFAQGLHHVKKRGEHLLNKKYLKRSCNPCNTYIEDHPSWAKKHGFTISKHIKETV